MKTTIISCLTIAAFAFAYSSDAQAQSRTVTISVTNVTKGQIMSPASVGFS